jgi:hypothetical protein
MLLSLPKAIFQIARECRAMDPLTALGLASNLVQFVDFTSKLFTATHRLYVSQSGAKPEYLELESLAQNIKELAEGAKPRNLPNTRNMTTQDKTLLELGNQCIEVSNQLLSVLESLKVKSGNGRRSWDSFYQALRSEWKKDDIELLQRRLDRISNQLNTRVLLDQQAKVASKLHELAEENRRLEAGRTREIYHLREEVQDLFKEIAKQFGGVEGARSRALAQLSRAAGKTVEYSSELSILDFLRFDTMDDRQVGVRKAHDKTFSWIFRTSASAGQRQSSYNFGEWLRSDHSLFWVTGKPGR